MSSRDLTLATAIGGGLMLWISSATTTIFWLLGEFSVCIGTSF